MARFYRSPLWKFPILDLSSWGWITNLDHFAGSRALTFTLNAPATGQAQVPSDEPLVNILDTGTIGGQFPLLEEGVRGVVGYRREWNGVSYDWVVRSAGIILNMEDAARSNEPLSAFTWYDPWQLLMHRPLRNSTGGLIGQGGMSFTATRGDVIVNDILNWSYSADGPFYTIWNDETWEATDQIDINFRQGLSVGAALQQLAATGTIDMWFRPFYDASLPQALAQMSVFNRMGQNRYNAGFSWDQPPYSLVDISRLEDGNQRANNVQFYSGQGGLPVTLQTDVTSEGIYGPYWDQQFFPVQNANVALEAYAAYELALRANGKVTVATSPAPERSPVPWNDYWLGDAVPVHASSRLRKQLTGWQRVWQVPLLIDDDATEQVQRILTLQDAGF